MTDTVVRLSNSLVGRYRILRELGQGGMATVYLAEDLRHDRQVALKVLRPDLAAVIGAERFLAEIKTTASLQHPHILPLHDSGDADGTVFYVMPYVEGESLRDRLKREKQLPVDEALRLTEEIASALDYAHRHKVVHRDIKPENILLHDGRAVVADFGIALAVSRSDGAGRMTETGMSLGTPHYMAPEQAMGEREITPKVDIYALGCVLYEMLSGDPPFTGSTAQAIVARVVTETPRSLVTQRHTVPMHVEAACFRALEKLPADRFATAGEFSAALETPATGAVLSHATHGGATRGAHVAAAGVGVVAAPAAMALRDWRARAVIPLAAVAIVAIAFAAWVWFRPDPTRFVRRYALGFSPAQAPLPDRPFALSPDARHLVYIGPAATGSQLWVKSSDRYDPSPLAGTARATGATFSPDGRHIAFVQGTQLKKMPIVGGSAITLADTANGARGLAWLDDGSILFFTPGGFTLRKVPDNGGPNTIVWKSDSADGFAPAALPGSKAALFVRCRGALCATESSLLAVDLTTHAVTPVVAGTMNARYARSGHLLYVRPDGGLFAVPFNPRSAKLTGSPVPVLDSVTLADGLYALWGLADDGTLVTRVGSTVSSRSMWELAWVDRTGRETVIDSSWTFRMVSMGSNSGWSLSPDGKRIAIGLNTDAGDDIWVKELPHGPLSRLSFDSLAEFRPRWSPDGRTVLFESNRNSSGLYRKRADGTGDAELLLHLPTLIAEGAVTPDGKTLLLRTGGTVNVVGGRSFFSLRPGVDTAPRPIVTGGAGDRSAIALSPDGHWLAYESNESGRTEVYLRPFPNTDAGKWQVSTSGGVAPLWARNGRELFFVNATRDLAVVPVIAGASLQLGERNVLFHLRDDLYLANQENYTPFDIAPDGQRFLMARRVRSAAVLSAPLVMVENWFDELRQRMERR